MNVFKAVANRLNGEVPSSASHRKTSKPELLSASESIKLHTCDLRSEGDAEIHNEKKHAFLYSTSCRAVLVQYPVQTRTLLEGQERINCLPDTGGDPVSPLVQSCSLKVAGHVALVSKRSRL